MFFVFSLSFIGFSMFDFFLSSYALGIAKFRFSETKYSDERSQAPSISSAVTNMRWNEMKWHFGGNYVDNIVRHRWFRLNRWTKNGDKEQSIKKWSFNTVAIIIIIIFITCAIIFLHNHQFVIVAISIDWYLSLTWKRENYLRTKTMNDEGEKN